MSFLPALKRKLINKVVCVAQKTVYVLTGCIIRSTDVKYKLSQRVYIARDTANADGRAHLRFMNHLKKKIEKEKSVIYFSKDHTIGQIRCDFSNSWCQWKPNTGQIPWERKKGPTVTQNTGPQRDHTQRASKYFCSVIVPFICPLAVELFQEYHSRCDRQFPLRTF